MLTVYAYYDGYCYSALVRVLRSAPAGELPAPERGGCLARHAWGILALLVKALRARWPRVKIVFRGDSGFCRWRMLRWCEAHGVGYIVGIARNPRLQRQAEALLEAITRPQETSVRYLDAATGRKQRRFERSVWYAAHTWDNRARRVIVKAEHTARGANPRFVVTNLSPQTDRYLYTRLYCARGDMENRIKNQQMDLFADRASCHRFWSNQFRQLLSGLVTGGFTPSGQAITAMVDLLRQRVYALALGHEDLNDHGELRHDPALQTAFAWTPPDPLRVLPRHVDKQRGLGEVRPKSAKPCLNHGLSTQYRPWNPGLSLQTQKTSTSHCSCNIRARSLRRRTLGAP